MTFEGFWKNTKLSLLLLSYSSMLGVKAKQGKSYEITCA